MRKRRFAKASYSIAIAVIVAISSIALPASAGPSPNASKWALIVGVQQYKGKTKATYGARGDSYEMRDVLLRAGWRSEHIRILVDNQATAAGIRAGFKWLQQHATDNSFSVFSYSGHIKQMGGDRDRDREKVDEYLWPHDNKFISDAELAANMRAVRGHLWVNIAGCEAAGLDDGISAPHRLFTGSSREPEKSYEWPEEGNSVFMYFMIDRAIIRNYADYNGDKVVSIHEAFRHASAEAPRFTHRQRKGPQHPYLAGGHGEWFLRFPPPPPPPPPPPNNEPPPEECSWLCLPSFSY